MKKLLTVSLLLFTNFLVLSQITPVEVEFDLVRPLDEINIEGEVDAFPWISNDGLRLYYMNGVSGLEQILYTERPHIDSLFSVPVPLGINIEMDRNLSPWLSQDELNIYFFTGESNNNFSTTLYTASRTSIDDSFGALNQVTLITDKENYYVGPSLTPDFNQLFLFNSEGSGQNIVTFEKTGSFEYSEIGTIAIPDQHAPRPGQLSRDGLKYYMSLGSPNSTESLIYYTERETIDDLFEDFYLIINEEVNQEDGNAQHPSISANGQFMVFAKLTEFNWLANELYIAQNIGSVSVKEENSSTKIKISPNPAIDYITLSLNENRCTNSHLQLNIFNSNGSHIETASYDQYNNELRLNTSNYQSGFYIFSLVCKDGFRTTGKFIISK